MLLALVAQVGRLAAKEEDLERDLAFRTKLSEACASGRHHEAVEERRELVMGIERQHVRDILIGPHDDDAALLSDRCRAASKMSLPPLRSGQNIFS